MLVIQNIARKHVSIKQYAKLNATLQIFVLTWRDETYAPLMRNQLASYSS